MGKRPDYAVVVYCNLIRSMYKDSPIIVGGIEASLRRLAHYDYWSDRLKRSILLDSQADLVSYGMGERYDALNQKGRTVVNQVEEKFCFQGDKTYCPAPFFWTDTGFGLYAETNETTMFRFEEDGIAVGLPRNCDVILFAGTPAEIIRDYMGLFGPAKLPPEWAFGPWISANRWNTQAEVEEQLSKTGGTPYRVTEVRSLVQDGLAVPLSALNGLRRQVLDGLSAQRAALPQRRHSEYKVGARYENYRGEPDIYLSLRRAGQLTFELIRAKPDLITLPAEEIAAHPEDVNGAVSRGVPVAAVLPRICFDRELDLSLIHI